MTIPSPSLLSSPIQYFPGHRYLSIQWSRQIPNCSAVSPGLNAPTPLSSGQSTATLLARVLLSLALLARVYSLLPRVYSIELYCTVM